ncbi:hypothetical protein [uncultured Microbulbifer sp.]|uniref:hypothetical protein n=1 Tax=uncultured Microbulbifer sp. TaxID=348147 RepID=UPI002604AF98|nr:hypothetical protein [uncultured Microbulbifer sp.]
MKKAILLGTIYFLTSCASTKLTSGAEQVRFTKGIPNADEYEYITDVSCSYTGSFSSILDIIKSCRNDMKNQAAQQAGTLVFIENEQMGSGNCLKCIYMVGSAYRKKQPGM